MESDVSETAKRLSRIFRACKAVGESAAESALILAVRRLSIGTDPPGDLWCIRLVWDNHEWRETFGAEAEARAFVQGVRASAAWFGNPYVPEPDWPPESQTEFVPVVIPEWDE